MLNPQVGFHSYYVYIITNKFRSTFYIGMTNNLKLRLQQHKSNIETNTKTFASKYNIEFLVFYEKFTWGSRSYCKRKRIKKMEKR